MAYTLRTKDDPLDLGRAADQNESVDNDILFNTLTAPIATVVLTGDAAIIEFAAIPATFHHLLIEFYARGDNASASINIALEINDDAGNNYDQLLAQFKHNVSFVTVENIAGTDIRSAQIASANSAADAFDMGTIKLNNYANSVGEKSLLGSYSLKLDDLTTLIYTNVWSGWWRSTAPIAKIDLIASAGNFIAGSVFSIRGVL